MEIDRKWNGAKVVQETLLLVYYYFLFAGAFQVEIIINR